MVTAPALTGVVKLEQVGRQLPLRSPTDSRLQLLAAHQS
jgi:hypothetical protein